ncbi:regulating synaptic membrane exocytosis protein 2 [Turdus rufiventris]|nr:regulating synaptic membrane exocytosis protein 2 [Turdus rufiventris]
MYSHEPEASYFPEVQWLIKRKRSPSISREQSRRYDQRDERDEYSQYATSDSAMPRSPSDYSDRRSQRGPQLYEEPELGDYRDSNRRSRRRSKEYPVEEEDAQSREEYERQRREEEYQARYRSDPNLARYPVKPQPYEEQMRIHAEVSRARHERRHSDVSLANAELEDSRMSMLRMERPSRQRSVSERRAAMENQRSYSMERTREAQGPSPNRQRTTNHSPPTPRRSPIPLERPDMRRSDSLRKQHHLDPSSAVRKTKREKMETMLRNDSLSSDQSESVRPPPPKPHKTKKGGKMRQVSLSSSEEELASTPEYTSCDDVEIESESVSEKDDTYCKDGNNMCKGTTLVSLLWQQKSSLRFLKQLVFFLKFSDGLVNKQDGMRYVFEEKVNLEMPIIQRNENAPGYTLPLKGDSQRGKRKTSEQAVLSDSNALSERQKKMVCFGGHSLEEDLEWSEPQIKDSGVDTCSSTTLNEEHSHSEKVVGGKMTESGRLCAFITKVKKGSLADTVGHLRPGDEVLEWNGRILQGATFEEVYNIILESKPEPQVELVVSRPIGDIPRIPDSTHAQLESSSSSFESQKMDRPSISVTSPMSPGMLRDVPQFLSGQLSIKLWYDKVGHQLIVTILGAKDLPSREDGRPRNPYVKIYFLPDRSDKNKRRTKTVKKTLEPKWNQTFIYSPVHRREFRERMLEITLWDQARVREEESEFLGEILIELETALLDDEPHWYKLQTHDVSSLPLPHPSPYLPRRQLHGESPTRRLQRSKRISDSEVSDYDCDDGIGVVSDYRHNGRDLQSSTLSVPEQVMSSNHCSRSGSPHRGDSIGRTRSWSPSVPPPQSRNVDPGLRGTRSTAAHYNTLNRMDRHRVMDDHYSPDRESQDHTMYPLFCEDAIRLLRSRTMCRAYSEGAYYDLERWYNGASSWADDIVNGSTEKYGSHPRTGSVQTSPSSTPVVGRRGRQLPQLPPKGTLERNNGDKEIESYEEVTWEDQQKKVNGTITDDKPLPKKKHHSETESRRFDGYYLKLSCNGFIITGCQEHCSVIKYPTFATETFDFQGAVEQQNSKKSRYILGLCSVYEKSHPPGFQVREKRKIKTEPGPELWSSQRDGYVLFQGAWSPCYMRLHGVTWVKSDGTLAPPEEKKTDPENGDTGTMDVEERNRQMKMSKYKQYRPGRDPHRGSDNVSNKSSDSDVSDVSAVSRTSSASRFSSTSYMSVQSERPRGNKKIRRTRDIEGKKEGGLEGDEQDEVFPEEEEKEEEEEKAKEQEINEKGEGQEVTENCDKEEIKESGNDEKAQEDQAEEGKEDDRIEHNRSGDKDSNSRN